MRPKGVPARRALPWTTTTASGWLTSLRDWLQANTHAVMAIVLVVMGSVVVGRGIGGL